jgi:hypothetical protein
MKNIIEEFKEILRSQDKKKVVSFLKSLSPKEKKILVPTLIQYNKSYQNKYFSINLTTLLSPQSQMSKEIKEDTQYSFDFILLAGLVCVDRETFETFIGCKNIQKVLERYNVIDWGIQKWFHQYLEENPYCIGSYDKLVIYIHNKKLHPSKDTIRKILLYDVPKETNLDDSTLHTHLWYILDTTPDDQWHIKKEPWVLLLSKLLQETLISQDKVLKEFLSAPRESIYLDILFNLPIEVKSYLKRQNMLLSFLDTNNNKLLNIVLKLLKPLAKESNFNVSLFMEYLEFLFSSAIKSIQNSTLVIVNTLLKEHPKYKNTLILMLPQLLIHKDEKLQIKVIKIIKKHTTLEENLLQAIEPYYNTLFTEAKNLLPNSIHSLQETTDKTIVTQENHLIEIDYPKEFNELIFFFTTAFENKEIYNFDLVLHNILNINKLLNEDNIDTFIPIIQTAYHTAHTLNFNKGLVTYIAIDLVLRYAQLLAKRYPQYEKEINAIMKEMPYFNYINHKVYCYKPFIHLSHLVQEKLLQDITAPLLSTPTHSCAFIDISIFIQRIKKYEEMKLNIDPIDMQIAIARVIPDEKVTNQIDILDSTEIKTLLHYINSDTALNIDSIETPELWISALLRKNHKKDLALFQRYFEVTKEGLFPYLLPQWSGGYIDYHNGLYGKDAIYSLSQKTPRNGINFEHRLFYKISKIDNIYTQVNTIDLQYDIHKNDDEKFLLLSPYYVEPMLLNSIRVHNYDKSFPRANLLRHAENIIPLLMQLWQYNHISQIPYLYLACSIVDQNQTIRTLSIELWYKATTEGTMNHYLLGKTLGKLEHNEYAPLKRFTDLVVSDMLNISPLHNQGLHTLLSAMIAHMSDEPIKGVKKLLEIYLEVLSLTNLEIPQKTRTKLDVLGEVKSLRSVVKKVLG